MAYIYYRKEFVLELSIFDKKNHIFNSSSKNTHKDLLMYIFAHFPKFIVTLTLYILN